MGQGRPLWLRKDTGGQGKLEGEDSDCHACPSNANRRTVCIEGESRHESKHPSGRPLQTNPGVGCIWWCASASTSWTGACEGPNSRLADPGLAEGHRLSWVRWRAVKPLPHLSWRDRFNCIFCQEDNNPLAQDRGISDCHRSLENAAELGRSPGKLNHIAASDCANEPAGRVGQCKPRPQTPYKSKGQSTYPQWCSGRESSWIAQKASRSDWSRQNYPHPRRDWPEMHGGIASPNCSLLAICKRGHRGREWGGSASHTVSPRAGKPRGKGNCSFFDNVVTSGWNRNKRLSARPSSGGKERHCSCHLLRKSSFPHIRVARVRAALSPSWTISGPAGNWGAPRSCERLDAPA